jgi:hypothetical protein
MTNIRSNRQFANRIPTRHKRPRKVCWTVKLELADAANRGNAVLVIAAFKVPLRRLANCVHLIKPLSISMLRLQPLN